MLSGRTAHRVLIWMTVFALVPVLVHAGSPLGIGTAEPSFQTGGPFGGFLSFINSEQQSFYRLLTDALKAMRTDPWALSSLVGLSFAYGVFHAAGPGHGKAVISSYMIANETELKRGVVISFASSFLQGGTALLVVGGAYLVLRGTSISMTDATDAFERLSFASIIAFGLWLLYRKIRAIAAPAHMMTADGLRIATHDHHGHDHSHHTHAAGEVCETCGHVHAPSPESLKGDTFNLREAWSAIVAVGMRPCSGALLVLTFSLLNGLYLGGFLSVMAMSFGTALTVSALATLAVMAKGAALRYAGAGTSGQRIGNAIEIFGALIIITLGTILLAASLTA
jgi:ABC-type nickel/cobalt efflux system permease component RcnA